jgi:hypothetical protein
METFIEILTGLAVVGIAAGARTVLNRWRKNNSRGRRRGRHSARPRRRRR